MESMIHKTDNNYWHWLVDSWKKPLQTIDAPTWYGVVTFIWEDLLLFIGLAIAGEDLASEMGMIIKGKPTFAFIFWGIILLLCMQAITILSSMVGHLFVFGKTGGFWKYVNKVAQASNLNFFVVIVTFFCVIFSTAVGPVRFSAICIYLASILFSLGSLLVAVQSGDSTENVRHDPFYGALIYIVIIAVASGIVGGLVGPLFVATLF